MTARRLGAPVTIVVEGRARAGADEADVDGVEVVHAPRSIVTWSWSRPADRELAERVRSANAEAVAPCWQLDQLVD